MSVELPVIAKQEPINVTMEQLRTAHDTIAVEGKHKASIWDGGLSLLAVTVETYDPFKKVTSLIRRDGLIVHEYHA